MRFLGAKLVKTARADGAALQTSRGKAEQCFSYPLLDYRTGLPYNVEENRNNEGKHQKGRVKEGKGSPEIYFYPIRKIFHQHPCPGCARPSLAFMF